MALPSNYSGSHGEQPHHFFKNVCISFKKTIAASKNANELQSEMERFIDSAKQMNWKNTEKPEKATSKVFTEFKRYIEMLESSPKTANPQDLTESIDEVMRLLDQHKAN